MATAPPSTATCATALHFSHPSLPWSNAGGVGHVHFFRRPFRAPQRRSGGEVARAALGGLLGGMFGGGGGDDGEAARRKYNDTVALVNRLETEVSALSDADLRSRTSELQERARAGESLDSLLSVRTQEHPESLTISCIRVHSRFQSDWRQ
uniref:Uncharacterized protein n=1 Tax=Avena sativa TaxID=4498 RepID=A0ACD5VIN7_AVESA